MTAVQKNPAHWQWLEEIRERREAATEPVLSTWVCFDGWGPPPDGDRMRAASISNGEVDVVASHPRGREIIAREDDLNFICHAPEDMDYLLERLERCREVLEKIANADGIPGFADRHKAAAQAQRRAARDLLDELERESA